MAFEICVVELHLPKSICVYHTLALFKNQSSEYFFLWPLDVVHHCTDFLLVQTWVKYGPWATYGTLDFLIWPAKHWFTLCEQ